MKRKLLVLIAVLVLMAAASVPAFAGQEEGVTCTVTPILVSVAVSPSTVGYGVVPLNDSAQSTTITATNDGSATQNLNIKGADATGGTGWTLSNTAVGPDQYMHEFSLDFSTWTALSTSYQQLASGVLSTASQDFMLQISMPTSTTDYVEKTTTVTVQAVAP